jgi:hypothetical protein
MDPDLEMRRLKRLGGVGLIFLVSAYFSWTELKFLLRGQTADATVTGITEYRKYNSIQYQFKDSTGAWRKENDQVPRSWAEPELGTTLKVQYFDAPDSSRLAGHSNKVAVYLFIACCLLLGFLIFQLLREARSKR